MFMCTGVAVPQGEGGVQWLGLAVRVCPQADPSLQRPGVGGGGKQGVHPPTGGGGEASVRPKQPLCTRQTSSPNHCSNRQ